jgi:hypothetical protein
MTSGMKTARNVGIVVAIAAAVYLLPGGGTAASTVEAALWVAFGLGMGFFAVRLYRENRMTLAALGDRHRALLYAGVAVGAFALAARSRMWETGLGEFAWFLLIAFVAYAFLETFRHSRSY